LTGSWINGAHSRDELLAELPTIGPAYEALYQSLWQQAHLPGTVLELCRLRLAQLHGSASELARSDCGLDATARQELSSWNTSTAISAAEKACLSFAEVYAMDAQALTDEHADAVKVHFGDAGLVMLVEALGIFDGLARLSLLWQLPAAATEGGRS